MLEFIKKNYGRLGMSFALVMLVINYFQRQELVNLREERDSLTKHMVESHALQGGDIQKAELIDSLQSELFNEKTMNGRYELSLDHLKEINPKAGKEFEDFFYKETE